jgi:hypothetical protein
MHILIWLLCLVALPGLSIAYAYHSGYLGYVLVRAMAYGCRSTTLPSTLVPQGIGSVEINQVAPNQI